MSEYSLASPRLWRALEGWTFRQCIDAYIERLQAEGFSNRPTFHAVRAIGEYARWLTDHHGDDIDVHGNTIAAFTGWREQQPGYRHGTRIAIVRLRENGISAGPGSSGYQRRQLRSLSIQVRSVARSAASTG